MLFGPGVGCDMQMMQWTVDFVAILVAVASSHRDKNPRPGAAKKKQQQQAWQGGHDGGGGGGGGGEGGDCAANNSTAVLLGVAAGVTKTQGGMGYALDGGRHVAQEAQGRTHVARPLPNKAADLRPSWALGSAVQPLLRSGTLATAQRDGESYGMCSTESYVWLRGDQPGRPAGMARCDVDRRGAVVRPSVSPERRDWVSSTAWQASSRRRPRLEPAKPAHRGARLGRAGTTGGRSAA